MIYTMSNLKYLSSVSLVDSFLSIIKSITNMLKLKFIFSKNLYEHFLEIISNLYYRI